MNQTIIDAIHNKKRLSFSNSGVLRTVKPQAYGVTIEGKEVLRCYQVHGNTTFDSQNWELLDIAQISSICETQQHFLNPRPGYIRDDKTMEKIYAQI